MWSENAITKELNKITREVVIEDELAKAEKIKRQNSKQKKPQRSKKSE